MGPYHICLLGWLVALPLVSYAKDDLNPRNREVNRRPAIVPNPEFDDATYRATHREVELMSKLVKELEHANGKQRSLCP